jgi:hypothetical protein
MLFFAGCSQMQVKVDYDTAYDFSGKTNYVIAHNKVKGENTLISDRIQNALKAALNAKSYKEVTKNQADLLFVFHVNVKDKSDVQTDYEMLGYGGYGFSGGFGGTMIATTNTYNYKEGTLIVDALKRKTQKIVWHGIATDELSDSLTTPQEKTDYINKMVFKLMENFPREAK